MIMLKCNCMRETEEKIRQNIGASGKLFPVGTEFSVQLMNKLISSDDFSEFLTVPVLISWRHTAKSGRETIKKKELPLEPTYCMFCGEKR